MSDKNLEVALNFHKNNELKKAEEIYLQILKKIKTILMHYICLVL